MRIATRLLPWLALLMLAAPAFAAPPSLFLLPPQQADPLPELMIDGRYDVLFEPIPLRSSFAPQNQARWFRLDLGTRTDEGQMVVIARMPMQSVQVWLPDSRGGYQLQSQGFFEPKYEHFTPSAYAFELDRDVLPPRPVYLRIRHSGRLYLDVQVESALQFRRGERGFSAMIVFGITTLLVMLVFNTIFYIVLRERLYASFVAFVGVQLLWVLFATGIIFVVPGAEWTARLPGRISGTLIALSHVLLLMFVRDFARVPRFAPRVDWIFRAVAWMFGVLALLFLWPGDALQAVVSRIASAVFSIASPVLLLGTLWLWLRGSSRAGLFLIAWLPLGLMTMVRTAVSWGWVAPSMWTIYAPLMAVAFESLVLSVALALRLRTLREERDRAVQMAGVDALTGAMSRRAGEQRLRDVAQQLREQRAWLSLVFIDLDNLKMINDVYRHDAGDAALEALADRIRNGMPHDAALIRWGGDEFLVMLPGLSLDEATHVASELAAAWRATPLMHNGAAIALRASVGIAGASGEDIDVDRLRSQADAALYRAKRDGRDRVAIG